MPTTYAHYRFGKDVKSILPQNIKEIINQNIDLFNIGVHGPDILFYYKPIKKNQINDIGNTIHQKPGKIFFEKALEYINSITDKKTKSAALSYIYGFICHFSLDCESHKYINNKVNETSISHYEIEAEFDRLLLANDNLDPVKTILTKHINANEKNASIISNFYSNISNQEMNKTIKSMIFYLNALVAPSKLKRNTIFFLLKAANKYDDMHGLIINYSPNSKCKEINNTLLDIYKNRINEAKILIENFTDSVDTNINLDSEFNRTFEA